MKASGTTSNPNQKRGQKRGAGDVLSDVVGLEPTLNEQARPPAKRGKPSLTLDQQATGHPDLRSVGKGSQGQTAGSTVTEAEGEVRGGGDVHSGVAKRRTIDNNDANIGTDSSLETPRRPVKKMKMRGVPRTSKFIHNV